MRVGHRTPAPPGPAEVGLTDDTGVRLDAVRQTNNFDALRLVAAVSVIIGHAYVLGGRAAGVPYVLGLSPHYVGVAIFFAISGWLVTGSWERTRSTGLFVGSRLLRIMPLLIVVVLVSVLLLGPVMTSLPLREYLTSRRTWAYLSNLVLLPADGLPGVFAGVPYPGVVNGSLWTLRAEALCYLAVLVLGLVPRRWQAFGLAAWAACSVVLALGPEVRVAGASVSAAAGAWIYFVVAAFLRLYVPRRLLRVDVGVVVVVFWALAATLRPAWAIPVSWIALTYAVLSVGLASWPVVRRVGRIGDLSYGMYLWAFPVAQIVQSVAPGLPLTADVAVVVAVCLPLSFVSWHLLERPALRLRQRLPGKRDRAVAATALT